MATTLCPFCKKHSHMTPRWAKVWSKATRGRAATTCDECGHIVIAELEGRELASYGTTDSFQYTGTALDRAEMVTWLPLATEAPDVPDVPEAIERAAIEAYSSASVGNYMAAILMSRTVIEATAKAKGITNGVLKAKIDAMKESGLIRPAIAEQAHEVRFAGNDMAHGDIDDAPDSIDAEEILGLMAEVLSEVFQGPARLARLREKREAARAGSGA